MWRGTWTLFCPRSSQPSPLWLWVTQESSSGSLSQFPHLPGLTWNPSLLAAARGHEGPWAIVMQAFYIQAQAARR